MELNGETLRFIREHCKDDVRSLALQAPKYPGGYACCTDADSGQTGGS